MSDIEADGCPVWAPFVGFAGVMFALVFASESGRPPCTAGRGAVFAMQHRCIAASLHLYFWSRASRVPAPLVPSRLGVARTTAGDRPAIWVLCGFGRTAAVLKGYWCACLTDMAVVFLAELRVALAQPAVGRKST